MIARTDDPLRQWEQCITRCLAERVPAKRFAQFAQQVSSQGVEGRQLAERLIIHLTDAGHDVLQQSYISTALDNGLVDEAQLLQALLASATGNGKNATYLTRSSSIPSVRAQVVVIRIVVISCNSRVRPSTRAQATDTLNAVSRWMIMISPASRQRNGTGKIHLSEDDDVLSLQKAVAGLFCNLVNSNNYVRSALESDYVPGKDEPLPNSQR